MSKITLEDGKYTLVNELNEGGGFKALRYDEEWKSLAGDNLMLAAFHEIERLKEKIEGLEEDAEFLSCLEACGVDNWSGYSEAVEMYNEEDE
jgi:hypothetical protein